MRVAVRRNRVHASSSFVYKRQVIVFVNTLCGCSCVRAILRSNSATLSPHMYTKVVYVLNKKRKNDEENEDFQSI